MRALWPACPPGASRSITAVSQPLGRAVHGGREAGRAGADDHEVVQRRLGAWSAARGRRRSRAWSAPCRTVPSGSSTSGSSASSPPNSPAAAAPRHRARARATGRARGCGRGTSACRSCAPTIGCRRPERRRSGAALLIVPVVEQVVEDREEPLLGRRPRLHQVVVEPDVVDRLDRDVGVGVGGEQHELGVRGRRLRVPSSSMPVISGIR